MITGLAHINLLVPPGTLPLATAVYNGTLGLTPRPVPAHRVHDLAWFEIGDSGQQVHIAPDYNGSNGIVKAEEGGDEEGMKAKWSSRHPCFRLGSPELLEQLRVRIWEHFERGGEAAPLEADRPGGGASGMSAISFGVLLLVLLVLKTTNRWNRRSRRRVSHEVFREGLRGEQVGVQSLNGDIVDVKKGFGMSSWVWL